MAIAGLGSLVSQKILAHILGKTEYAKPAATYCALLTSMPATNKVTAKEIEETYEVKSATITNYARKEVKWNAATESGEVAKIVNENLLEWATLIGGPVTVVGYAIVTVTSGAGDCTGAAKLEATAEIGTGHTPATMAKESVEVNLK